SGTHADVVMTMARTDTPEDRKGARGIGAFIITPDLAGYTVGKKEDKMGLRASPTVQLHFENLRVPKQNLLGEPGLGFIYAMQSLDAGRLGIAAQAVGIAQAAWSHASKYAAERRQFGKPIKEFQAIQSRLADMAMKVAASRARLHAAATRRDCEQGARAGSPLPRSRRRISRHHRDPQHRSRTRARRNTVLELRHRRRSHRRRAAACPGHDVQERSRRTESRRREVRHHWRQ